MSCENGSMSRRRYCRGNVSRNLGCRGKNLAIASCNAEKCPGNLPIWKRYACAITVILT